MKKFLYLILAAIIAAGLVFSAAFAYKHYYLPHKFANLTEKILTQAMAELDVPTRAGQVMHIAIPGLELNDQNRKILSALKPGGIIFFGFNLESADQIKEFTTDLQQFARELKLPPFMISTDQEGGYVKRVQDGVLLTPSARRLGDIGDSEICRATGYHVSHDLGALGINVFFAPIVDINNNPKNPVIGLRSFGTTLPAVLACALPFESGARTAHNLGGALPVIKHFPGHGDTYVDSHWSLPVIDKPLSELKAFELVPFRKAIEDGTQAIMSAHILYPQIDNSAPATLSQRWLTDVLRHEMGFHGIIFTDAMEMKAVSKHYATVNRPLQAINAGADVLLYTSWQDEPFAAKDRLVHAIAAHEFTAAVKNDKTNVSRLEQAIKNQLRAKLPYMTITNYLPAEDATWYLSYLKKIQAINSTKPIVLSEADLVHEFKNPRWRSQQKHTSTTWRAGQNN